MKDYQGKNSSSLDWLIDSRWQSEHTRFAPKPSTDPAAAVPQKACITLSQPAQ